MDNIAVVYCPFREDFTIAFIPLTYCHHHRKDLACIVFHQVIDDKYGIVAQNMVDVSTKLVKASRLIEKSLKAYMVKKQIRTGTYLYFLVLIISPVFFCGCSQFYEGKFQEANNFFIQRNYSASLNKYEQMLEKYPIIGDRVLFEMGIIYMFPQNDQKDYPKAMDCFQKIIRKYPDSQYRSNSEALISLINSITAKDNQILLQQELVNTLKRDVSSKGSEIGALQSMNRSLELELKLKESELIPLQKKIESLVQTVYAIRNGPVDKVLIEKKDRRLTLLAGKKVLKTYKIALGGNPDGPKERQGDNKTPEGVYHIDSRNNNSLYHLSLHISYPNEKDKKRACELGVSPGGDIMIHGIKNGFSWVGEQHATIDWTKGCIAVTDDEIEEIADLVPNGTTVEIKP